MREASNILELGNGGPSPVFKDALTGFVRDYEAASLPHFDPIGA